MLSETTSLNSLVRVFTPWQSPFLLRMPRRPKASATIQTEVTQRCTANSAPPVESAMLQPSRPSRVAPKRAPIVSLARVEIQSIMHFLTRSEVSLFGRCNHRTYIDTDETAAWKHVPTGVIMNETPVSVRYARSACFRNAVEEIHFEVAFHTKKSQFTTPALTGIMSAAFVRLQSLVIDTQMVFQFFEMQHPTFLNLKKLIIYPTLMKSDAQLRQQRLDSPMQWPPMLQLECLHLPSTHYLPPCNSAPQKMFPRLKSLMLVYTGNHSDDNGHDISWIVQCAQCSLDNLSLGEVTWTKALAEVLSQCSRLRRLFLFLSSSFYKSRLVDIAESFLHSLPTRLERLEISPLDSQLTYSFLRESERLSDTSSSISPACTPTESATLAVNLNGVSCYPSSGSLARLQELQQRFATSMHLMMYSNSSASIGSWETSFDAVVHPVQFLLVPPTWNRSHTSMKESEKKRVYVPELDLELDRCFPETPHARRDVIL